jgi:hypothetical protein
MMEAVGDVRMGHDSDVNMLMISARPPRKDTFTLARLRRHSLTPQTSRDDLLLLHRKAISVLISWDHRAIRAMVVILHIRAQSFTLLV